MKPERRSMTAAIHSAADLPPEALALIKAGTPKPASSSPVVAAEPSEPQTTAAPAVPALAQDSRPASDDLPTEVTARPAAGSKRQRGRPKGSVSRPVDEGVRLVGTSYRLPEDLVFRVMKASAERKVRRIRPWAQQDMVAEALDAWLKAAGY